MRRLRRDIGKILLKGNIFLILFLVYVILLSGVSVIQSQKKLFLFVNRHYSTYADFVLRYLTHLGDGLFMVAIAAGLFFYKKSFGITITLAGLVSGCLVQILKQIIFTHQDRPWMALKDIKDIHLVEDFTPYINNSFPSGHTATAFCLFMLLSFFVNRKIWQFLFFAMATMVAYSRVYLSQHFVIDALVGAIIGTLSAFFFYYICIQRRSRFSAMLMKLK